MKVVNEQIEIDGIDKQILRALMQDARTPILSIARTIGISGAAIHQRLRKLEDAKLPARCFSVTTTSIKIDDGTSTDPMPLRHVTSFSISYVSHVDLVILLVDTDSVNE